MSKSLYPFIFLLSFPTFSHAALTPVPYAGAALELQSISVGDSDFDASIIVLRAGAWLSEGIGLELELGKSLNEDVQNGVSLEHASMLRFGLRLQTPATPNNTVLYVLFSGTNSKLDLQTAGDGVPGKNGFSGYHAGVGLGTRLNSRVQLDFSYHNYQVDENIDITGFRLNVEYTFGAVN